MFGINPKAREVFPHNFLRSVEIRTSFAPNQGCSDERSRFAGLFEKTLPKVDDSSVLTIELKDQGAEFNSAPNKHRLLLQSPDLQRGMTLTNSDCVYSITGEGYKGFDDMRKQYSNAMFFLKSCGVDKLNVLSLRKVNALQFKAESKNGAMAPAHGGINQIIEGSLLLRYDELKTINPYLKRSFQTLQLEEKDYNLVIKYGLETLKRDANNSQIEGAVIIDLSIVKRGVEIDNCEEELIVFNKEIYDAFLWTISANALNFLQNGI